MKTIFIDKIVHDVCVRVCYIHWYYLFDNIIVIIVTKMVKYNVLQWPILFPLRV